MSTPQKPWKERYRLYEEDCWKAQLLVEPERSIEYARLNVLYAELMDEFKKANPKADLSSVDKIKEQFELVAKEQKIKGTLSDDGFKLYSWVKRNFPMPPPVFQNNNWNVLCLELELLSDKASEVDAEKSRPGRKVIDWEVYWNSILKPHERYVYTSWTTKAPDDKKSHADTERTIAEEVNKEFKPTPRLQQQSIKSIVAKIRAKKPEKSFREWQASKAVAKTDKK